MERHLWASALAIWRPFATLQSTWAFQYRSRGRTRNGLATVPGNYAMNLRRLYLLNSNYADLSFLFTILPGERTNAHLASEYLAVLETDNCTPYFLNLHNGEVAHTLILGMTGSGKSYFCNFILQNAQKYGPLTFIFDIGGSFQSLTTIFGGS
jgi:type IV secretion system protein VirB4